MKTIIKIIILLTSIVTNSQNIKNDTLHLKHEHYKLRNGLEVILQPDNTVKNVSVEFWLKDGISLDTEEQYGLMHFYEHIMPYSKMADSIRRNKYYKLLVNSNAQVKNDYSRFYLEVNPEALDIALEVSSGRIKADTSRITSKRIERERIRVLAEIDRNAKNPLWSAPGGMAINAGVFGKKHPYGHNGYGLIKNNENFTLKQFRNRHLKVAYAKNTILFIVGNFEIKSTKDQIIKYFSSIQSKKKYDVKIKPSNHSTKRMVMKNPSNKDSLNTLVLSWQLPKYSSLDNDALLLFAEILNKHIKNSSHKISSIKSSNTYIDLYKYAGKLTSKFIFNNINDSKRIETFLNKILDQVFTNNITYEDLNSAKKILMKKIYEKQKNLGFQNSRAEILGESLLFTNKPDYYLKRLKRQEVITKEEVKEIAKKWLSKKPFTILFKAVNN